MKCTHLMPTGFLLLLSMGMSNMVAAQAQEVPPEVDPVPEQALPQSNFSDEQLKSFVEVQTGIQTIREEYTARIEETNDPEAVGKLQQEANEEMVEVVQSNALDVETYNQIAQALQQDPALVQRVQEMMN